MARHFAGYVGGAYFAGPNRALRRSFPLASNAPQTSVVSTTECAFDSATVLVLSENAKAKAATQGVSAMLRNIQPLLRASRTKPATTEDCFLWETLALFHLIRSGGRTQGT